MARTRSTATDILNGPPVQGPGFGQPVTPLTVAPVNPPTATRVTFGFKCDPAVKRQFARFVKWYNREADPADETEMGQLAEEALVRFMAEKGYKESTP